MERIVRENSLRYQRCQIPKCRVTKKEVFDFNHSRNEMLTMKKLHRCNSFRQVDNQTINCYEPHNILYVYIEHTEIETELGIRERERKRKQPRPWKRTAFIQRSAIVMGNHNMRFMVFYAFSCSKYQQKKKKICIY